MIVSALRVSAVQKNSPEQAGGLILHPQPVCWVATKHRDRPTRGNPVGKLRPWCLRGVITAQSLFGLFPGYQGLSGAYPTFFQGGK